MQADGINPVETVGPALDTWRQRAIRPAGSPAIHEAVPSPLPQPTERRDPQPPTAGHGANQEDGRSSIQVLSPSFARIRFDDESNIVLIQIVDAVSGEVIREIPPEEWVQMHKSLPQPKGTLVEKQS